MLVIAGRCCWGYYCEWWRCHHRQNGVGVKKEKTLTCWWWRRLTIVDAWARVVIVRGVVTDA